MTKQVNNQDKAIFAGEQGYNDEVQRTAFKKMMGSCKILSQFLVKYVNCENTNDTYYIKIDPLGDFKVDLGILRVSDDKVMGLVEVDVFNKWVDNWPRNYTKVNRLARKEKYYKDKGLPYVNISFNTSGTNGIMTDMETEQKYRLTEWYVPEVSAMEKGRRINLEDAIKIGEWAA